MNGVWGELFRFELEYHLKRPLFWGSSIAFLALGVALGSSDVGGGGSWDLLLRNSPLSLAGVMPIVTLLGLFVITAYAANAALRDWEIGMSPLLFTKPIAPKQYLSARFCAAVIVSLLVLTSAVAGLVASWWAPWQSAERLGPADPWAYVFAWAVIMVPNVLATGALMFAACLWSRRLVVPFLGAVIYIGLQDLIEVVAERMQNRFLGALLEPSGISALNTITRYWTVAEKNVRFPDLMGVLAVNRLVWLVLGFGLLFWVYRRFEFGVAAKGVSRKSRRPSEPVARPRSDASLPLASKVFGPGTELRQLVSQTRVEAADALRGVPFAVLMAIGLLFVGAMAFFIGEFRGVSAMPYSHLMVQAVQISSSSLLMVALVFYSGELLYRQGSLKMSDLSDSMPVSDRVLLVSKVLSLLMVLGTFLGLSLTATAFSQIVRGFTDLRPEVYAQGLVVLGWPFLVLIAIALFLQVVSGRKMVGFALVLLVWIAKVALPRAGLESRLYLPAGHPAVTFSDWNGYGHFMAPMLWHALYWGFAAVVLLFGARLLWVRGRRFDRADRLRALRDRLNRPLLAGLALLTLGMSVTGVWIQGQTEAARSLSVPERVRKLATYELRYRSYADLPLPTIEAVTSRVDFYPERRGLGISGTYRLRNLGPEPIVELPVTVSPRWVEGVVPVFGSRIELSAVTLGGRQPEPRIEDPELGFFLYRPAKPLAPGETTEMSFVVEVEHPGFGNHRQDFLVVENGSFFTDSNFFPVLGYAPSNELISESRRRRHGLGSHPGMPEPTDPSATDRNYLGASWIDFASVVSTSVGQTAITSGELLEDWVEGDRHYFRYQSRGPMLGFVGFHSGRYEKTLRSWNDTQIEVYLHPDHGRHLDRILTTTVATLEQMTEMLGPYPHPVLRIVEIPRYHQRVAFSLPQVLAISEDMGLTTDFREDDVDYLSAIVAHEVAHQWWNHQLVPAEAQGATLIAEALTEYCALRVMEGQFGAEVVRQLLKESADRYLSSRSRSQMVEKPLDRVDRSQGHIHYAKGSTALYALSEEMGVETFHQALRGFFADFALKGPPYPLTKDLLARISAAAPEVEPRIDDLFRTVTLLDLSLDRARVREADGGFLLEIELGHQKQMEDESGAMQVLDVSESATLAIFGETPDGSGERLLEEREVRLEGRSTVLSLDLPERPVRAEIDPGYLKIDRDRSDNSRRAQTGKEST